MTALRVALSLLVVTWAFDAVAQNLVVTNARIIDAHRFSLISIRRADHCSAIADRFPGTRLSSAGQRSGQRAPVMGGGDFVRVWKRYELAST
jgi:hypothetical protein